MSNVIDPKTTTDRWAGVIPPLENGDRLTREEFYRRWEAMPGIKLAQRIEGVVYMPAAVRHVYHGGPHNELSGPAWFYKVNTPGTDAGNDSTLRVDADNDLQADVFIRILPEHGCQTRTTVDGYVVGPPEFVVEVAASSANIDLHDKLDVYRRAGVREYVVWRVLDREFDWFVLRGSTFERHEPESDGVHRSVALPGLWLDTAAFVAGDGKRIFEVLNAGVTSPEHAAFVERLAAAKSD